MFFYQDRQDAGSELAQLIMTANIKDPVILALSRGGVPVASMIAHELGRPFEVVVTRNVNYPGHKEMNIGAMTEDERPFLTDDINYADPRILEVINEERHELRRKVEIYRQGCTLPEVRGRNVVLVDDGLTDELSALVTAKLIKDRGAKKITLAVPVAPVEEGSILRRYIDQIICPHRVNAESSAENSLAPWFQDFGQVSDQEVLELLGRAPRSS